MSRERQKTIEKQKCKYAWDKIASEYYSNDHETTRNFDLTIRSNIYRLIPSLERKNTYLDIGSGKGKLQELYPDCSSEIIVGDLSLTMLKSNYDTKNIGSIQMDAFQIPIRENSFDAVFSFLGDSYFTEKAAKEIYRVLKTQGLFFMAIPALVWRKAIAPFLGIIEQETTFKLSDGSRLNVPSFVYDPEEITEMLQQCGFNVIHSGNWSLSGDFARTRVAKQVTLAAEMLGIPPQNLPIVTYTIARK